MGLTQSPCLFSEGNLRFAKHQKDFENLTVLFVRDSLV